MDWKTMAALAVIAAVGPAVAQPATTRLAGVIERVEGSTLIVRSGEATAKLVLPDNARVFAVTRATMSDIKPNAFIGVGAMPQPDGSQQAVQISIFAEVQRGLGEGHRPWSRPGGTMTNGTVDTIVTSVSGRELMVKYRDGEKKIIVGPDAVIRAYAVGERSELKPGAAISTFASKRVDGEFEAPSISVGRDGVVP